MKFNRYNSFFFFVDENQIFQHSSFYFDISIGKVIIVMKHMFGKIAQEIAGEARQVYKHILAFN